MPRYFVGNVLSPTDTQPEADDHTFAFTREEAGKLDLMNTPICMEHTPELECGKITRHWQAKDGSVWVVGALNDKGLEASFAKYAIEKNADGDAYYTGLSLQHTHTQYASHKNSKKEAIEVSLCVNPRRSDCRIAFVDSEPNAHETEKVVYKIHKASLKSNMAETTSAPPAVTQVQENKPAEANVEATPAPASDAQSIGADMSREDMMRVIIQQQKELEESQSMKDTEMQELKALKTRLEQQEAEEMKQRERKAQTMVKALLSEWEKTLDATEFDEASRESVMAMAKTHPRESEALMRIAHCASKKHAALNAQFTEYKEMMKRTQLQEKFEQVMSKKRPAPAAIAPPAAPVVTHEVVHAASTKRAKVAQNDVSKFLNAMKKYSSSGSARDHMDAVSKIGAPRRNMGPRSAPNRAPYY